MKAWKVCLEQSAQECYRAWEEGLTEGQPYNLLYQENRLWFRDPVTCTKCLSAKIQFLKSEGVL